jgi:hypothetical protein
MENLFWVTMSLIGLSVVIVIWFSINNNDRKKEHEKLKMELSQRLFLKNQLGTFDLPSCIEAMLIYHKLRLEGTRGVKVVKE